MPKNHLWFYGKKIFWFYEKNIRKAATGSCGLSDIFLIKSEIFFLHKIRNDFSYQKAFKIIIAHFKTVIRTQSVARSLNQCPNMRLVRPEAKTGKDRWKIVNKKFCLFWLAFDYFIGLKLSVMMNSFSIVSP